MASIPLHSAYAFDDDETIIEDFINNKAFNLTHDQMADVLNAIFQICAANAAIKGFHDINKLENIPNIVQRNALKIQLMQAEVARIVEECGELIDAIRKPRPDEHCPEFMAVAMEMADIFIRLGDMANKHSIDLGQAIMAKMRYNTTRQRLHGKNS